MNVMRQAFAIRRLICTLAFATSAALPAAEIVIVTAPDAAPVERIAARELGHALQQLYPNDRFANRGELPTQGPVVLVGTATHAIIRPHLADAAPKSPESFVVRHVRAAGRELGVIAGADGRGTASGVYALLTRLGCGFMLDGDTFPRPRTTPFDFAGWSLSDRPLVPDRLVFNWHNFLSGCSTWNLAEWQRWTAQAQKLGYNAIMVHAYGNNPMAGFTFDGEPRPVGFLSTTVKGRDWSTMHVNDVRRLHGGEVFDGPVFGSAAGMVPDEERVAAAQSMMRAVFDHAAERAMGVYFAVDVDTPSANPPELVERLPESARFAISAVPARGAPSSRIWVPNPDTPEGAAFYRAQVAEFLKTYPTLTTLVVWFRRGGTPWMEMKVGELPAAWQREFAAEVARTPEAASYWLAPGLFGVGKIVRAFDRALRELGASHVRLAAGTWSFGFLPAADRFFPAGVPLIGLDYDVLHGKSQLATDEARATLRRIGARRPVMPIMWAHHDDGHYLGRPYTPSPDFATKLADSGSAGFGIIHWTTRPLDLFFSSLAQQTWHTTRDRPLADTCRDAAERWFGATNRESLGAYLEAWMADAPLFGRETSDWFIDRRLTNLDAVTAGGRARLARLASADLADMTPAQRDRVAYFRGLEEFIIAAHETQVRLQESQDRLGKGDVAGAKQAIAHCDPAAVIRQYARFSRYGGMTRGEQGVVVTMNTRWLTHVIRQRQALGLEPVRIDFAPTSHDLLAQSRGKFTFHFEPDQTIWECWGAQETGADTFVLPAAAKVACDGLPASWEEIGRSGIVTAKPLALILRPMMAIDSRARGKPASLPPGNYRVRLLFVDPESSARGQRVFEVALRPTSRDPATAFPARESIDVFALAGGPGRMLERSYPVSLDREGSIELRLTPVHGQAVLCGAVVEPATAPDAR